MSATFQKTRARLEILNHITQFCLQAKISGDPIKPYNAQNCFESGHVRTPSHDEIGTLVALSSAGFSKWYLSWLRDIKRGGDRFSTVYVLESIEDGALCNWSNVSINAFDKSVVDQYPQWQWTDRQFAFNDRWMRVCHKEKDAYIVLPTLPQFHADGSVTLSTRTRFGFDDVRPSKTFPAWAKVTKAMMGDFYDWAVEEREKIRVDAKPAKRQQQPKRETRP